LWTATTHKTVDSINANDLAARRLDPNNTVVNVYAYHSAPLQVVDGKKRKRSTTVGAGGDDPNAAAEAESVDCRGLTAEQRKTLLAKNPFYEPALVAGKPPKRKKQVPKRALPPMISMAVGTRVRLLHTIQRDVRLVSGSVGSVYGWVYQQGADQGPIMPGASLQDALNSPQQPQVPIVLVQFDEGDYTGESCVDGVDRVVPISTVKYNIWMDGRSHQREMLPLEACTASTVHSAQGMTVERHVMIPPGGEYGNFARALLYVALSRCKSLQGLFLLKYLVTAEMFTKFFPHLAPITQEYERLRALPHWRVRVAELATAAAATAADT